MILRFWNLSVEWQQPDDATITAVRRWPRGWPKIRKFRGCGVNWWHHDSWRDGKRVRRRLERKLSGVYIREVWLRNLRGVKIGSPDGN